MQRILMVCAAGMLVVPAAATAQDRRGPRQSYANPSAVIAAELAFAQDAQVRGQWTAFAAAAATDAVMFTPQMVWAQVWLKGRPNPPAALRWQPYEVWSSCDGSLVVSHGVWREGGAGRQSGWFTTLWRREFDGSYKWVLDHGDSGAPTTAAPEMIAAHVADCPVRPHRPEEAGEGPGQRRPPAAPKRPKSIKVAQLPALDPARRAGAAADGSLRWEVSVSADGARTLTLRWTRDGAEVPLLVETVAAPAAPR